MAKRFKGIPNLPFAPIVGGLFGLAAVALVYATPNSLLEGAVSSLGIANLVTAAQPPLGDTARLLLAVAAGVLVGLVLWLVMRPIERAVHKRRVAADANRPQAVRPHATANSRAIEPKAVEPWTVRQGRAPIFAERDLGAPLMSDEALASGEELFLDSAMVDEALPQTAEAPLPVQDNFRSEVPLSPAPRILPLPVAEQSEPDLSIDLWERPVAPLTEPKSVTEQTISSAELPFEEAAPLDLAPPSFDVPPSVIWPVRDAQPAAASVEVPAITATSEPASSIIFETIRSAPLPIAEPVQPESVAKVVADEPALPAQLEKADEPSLRDLLARFETALAQRNDRAAIGDLAERAPSENTVATLRDLLMRNRKSAA